MILFSAVGCFVGAVSAAPTIMLELNGGGFVDSTETGTYFKDGYLYHNGKIAGNGYVDNGDETYTNIYNITKTGYSFLGWYNSTGDSKLQIFNAEGLFANSTYDDLNTNRNNLPEYVKVEGDVVVWNESYTGTITLYAMWDAEHTNLIFGESSDDDELHREIFTEDAQYSAGEYNDAIPNPPEKSGYVFKGWAAKKDGTLIFVPSTDNGNTLNFVSNDIGTYVKNGKWISSEENWDGEYQLTLIEKWEPVSSGGSSAAILSSTSKYRDTSVLVEYCQVFFEANGAEGTMEQQQFTVGEPRELKLNEFTYPEHTFIGWALEPQGEVVYTDGQEITISKDTTVYAKWIIPLPDIPDVQGDTDDNGLPTWVFILIGVIIAAIIIILLLYFFVFKRT